ncbi:hypothetical protein [Streptomyces glycanivorans]|uniref:Uncharacterized protein n=1 Tax=Streptomyces glycanivorans TaxID=3033808 RepID=A0ABY9JTV7_9ACTN|nr:hypothetical protein [Streptomyces sp. Alt3]WLQ69391.1 hypothetical protein P8A20_38435 [Streptomyces sp. Alt3]
MFERITNAFAVVRTLLSVLWIRAYRLVDNLLTGSPAWGRSPARRATAARLRTHRLVRPNVATD